GRAPVSAEGDAARFVDKVIRYEKYLDQSDHRLPADFAVSVLLGSENWCMADPNSLDVSAAGKEDIRRAYLAAAPGRFIFARHYEDFANVAVADQGPDLDTADTGRIVAGVQLPSNAVSLTSHGSPSYLCYLDIADVRSLINPPGIWYANGCLTNMIDVTPGNCLGEEAMLNPHGGAVAYVGNTRFGHTGDNPFELAFWEEMLRSPLLGEMFNACKRTCDNAWSQYAYNLLGDPAMRVWTDRPCDLEIGIRPFELCVDSDNTMSVSVYASGPVTDAVVVISQNGARLARSTSGRNGRASLTVHPRSTGQVDIAVFGDNLIPALRQRPVVQCSP
ncbi:MAG TPA: C25 family cysteine peptidase, partial [Propionibacteriaceae bacterium]|nr:C25 family cysteine peptidase [Propionibacteriaceae bacterium]